MTSTSATSITSGNLAGSSSSASLGTTAINNLGTLTSSVPPLTHDQIIAENAHRVVSNTALQVLRDAGDPNIALKGQQFCWDAEQCWVNAA
jgi:hypothetical protein